MVSVVGARSYWGFLVLREMKRMMLTMKIDGVRMELGSWMPHKVEVSFLDQRRWRSELCCLISVIEEVMKMNDGLM